MKKKELTSNPQGYPQAVWIKLEITKRSMDSEK